MKKIRKLTTLVALSALSIGGSVLVGAPASAALPVFDVSNYSQNLLQAARALEQINNQVKSLQNEASMLQNMAKHLEKFDFPELQQMTSALQQIDSLMNQAKAIDFKVSSLQQQFQKLFPAAVDNALKSDQRVAVAKARLDAAMDGFKHSMTVQAEIVSDIRDDAKLLGDLSQRSNSAVGSLQAEQASNQLLALSTKQQLQLQELMAAQFRSETLERARQVEAEKEGRAATQRFLGSGKAYAPGGN